jgi:hypothetical protein
MEKQLTFKQIESLQKGYRVNGIQDLINSGQCWMMEGSVGRFANDCLEAGICMYPLTEKPSYYGGYFPNRKMIKKNSAGSFQKAQQFWGLVWVGDFEAIDYLEETFGRDEENEVP